MNVSRSRITPVVIATTLLAALAGGLRADDRDFVRKSVQDPYIYILLDVSGSMNWTTKCSTADFAAGKCRQVCQDANPPSAGFQGDCYTPLQADGPASKFYQAKEALFEVVNSLDNVQFGFMTYNQDRLLTGNKHWLYRVTSTFNWTTLGSYPAVNRNDVFGLSWACTSGTDTGCGPTTPSDTNDAWELNRVHYWPKLGDGVTAQPFAASTFYIRQSGTVYRVTYNPPAVALGAATLTIPIGVRRCNNADCSNNTVLNGGNQNITFALVDEFLTWDVGDSRGPVQEGYFNQGETDMEASGTCNGWDANTDSANDPQGSSGGYNVRFPTSTPTDPRGAAFTNGDVVPADWNDNKKSTILSRLSPIAGNYDQAPFFNDHRSGTDTFLRLKNEAQRPLLAFGSTPLGFSLEGFYNWYRTSWRPVTAAQDLQWGCRRKYVLVLSDGDDTCCRSSPTGTFGGCCKDGSNRDILCNTTTLVSASNHGPTVACTVATNLRVQEAVKTYVVAFGVPGGGDALKCMAENGGQPDCKKCNVAPTFLTTGCVNPGEPNFAQCGDNLGDPLYPQNKDELVKALQDIFQEIKEEERAFASAAVPSVEANVKDKIFLSDFVPLSSESVWNGHLDAFLKPLPLRADNITPDDTPAAKCTTSDTANCHLWDAGDELIGQAPDLPSPIPATLSISDLKLGILADQRRVFYPGVGGVLQPFAPPSADADWVDLFKGMGFRDTTATGVPGTANKARARTIIGTTLDLKTATVTLPSGATDDIEFVMGDIFHSDPLVLESPHDTVDFDAAPEPAIGACRKVGGSFPGLGSSSNYRCFATKQQYRRKLVLVGANDAQLHAFDAGTFNDNTDRFEHGTGKEAFAIIPRQALPVAREQTEDNQHIFGVDGPVVAGDVFFASAQGGDNEWHTITVVGMREAGRKITGEVILSPETGSIAPNPPDLARFGYFALDITQPDPLTEEIDARTDLLRRFVPTAGPVPGCATLGTSPPAGCVRIFPSLLWEFTDRSPDTGKPLDEDNNNDGDMGAPWSKPILTRVKLAGNVIRPVLIFGGGLDPANKTLAQPRFGNYIYMVDARTGVPIYKREVEGSVPAVAVLDTNQDNVADFVYFGTTAGRVYKINLTTAQALAPVVVRDVADLPVAGTTVQRVTAAAWNPFLVFTTGNNHPVYEEIQLLSVQKLGRYALVFGTGDREDLWNFDGIASRFYVLVDEGWTAATGLTEANYRRILAGDAGLGGVNGNPLLSPTGTDALGQPFRKGWYLFLDPSERVITKGFGVSGVLIFSSFQPQVLQEGTPLDRVCSRTGISRNFVVQTINANAVATLDPLESGIPPCVGGCGIPDCDAGNCQRFKETPDFLTNPFVEQVQTQNLDNESGVQAADADCINNDRLAAVGEVLKKSGPEGAAYGNYFLRLGQRETKRGIFYPACVPIAVIDRNWKEN